MPRRRNEPPTPDPVDLLAGPLDEPVLDDPDIEFRDDGGLTVYLDEEPDAEAPPEVGWFDNLAATLEPGERKAIARRLLDLIEQDEASRKPRDDQQQETIRRSGLTKDVIGGASFNGASKVADPVIAEVAIDFAARTFRELFPPGGPVKSKIAKRATRKLLKKAERVSTYMNWQCTEQIKELRAEIQQLLSQLPYGGSQYLRLWWDRRHRRPRAEFYAVDDVILPYAASSFQTAERKTLRGYTTIDERRRLVASGEWIDIDLDVTADLPQPTQSQQVTDRIEGKNQDGENADGVREKLDVFVEDLDIPGFGPGPYYLTIDRSRADMPCLYRNWDEPEDDPEAAELLNEELDGDDGVREPLDWVVDFNFLPTRGALGLSLGHIIGQLSTAETGALRALLDSALANTIPAMLKLKGGRIGGQTDQLEPGSTIEIEGEAVDDIRKIAMPIPYNQPSPTLYSLLGFLGDRMRSVVRMSLDLSEQNIMAQPTTVMAAIEQGMVVYSAIFTGLHDSIKRVLAIIHRLNRSYLDDEIVVEQLGGLVVRREDFEGPMDVIPVSDPAVFSETQRLQQMQFVIQRAQAFPMLYNLPAVERRLNQIAKIPAYEELLAPTAEAEELDAVEENVRAAQGKPIEVYPDQNHIAHLQEHLAFLDDPNLGSNPLVAMSVLMPMVPHVRDHILGWYRQSMTSTIRDASGIDMDDEQTDDGEIPEEIRRGLERLQAMAGSIIHDPAKTEPPRVISAVPDVFMRVGAAMKAAQGMMQQLMPPAPPDPGVEVMKMDVQRKQQADQAKAQTDQARVQIEGQKAMAAAQHDQALIQVDQADLQLRAQFEQLKAQYDAQSLELERMRIEAQERIAAQNNITEIQKNDADNEAAKQIQAAKMLNDREVRDNAIRGEGPNPQART